MPVHDACATLEQSVSSVCAQSFQDWELLIVDDASSDGSDKIARALGAKDARIRVLEMESNKGAAAARNHALAHAQGRYIAFLDADDLWHPEKLTRQLAFMQDNNAALCCTAYARMAPSHALIEQVNVETKISYNNLLQRNLMGCLTVVYDTAELGKVDMPLLTRQQDYALWLQLARRANGAYGLNEVLAIYRVGQGTLSSNKAAGAYDIWRIYRKCEGLGIITSAWYFAHYAWYGLRHRLFQRPKSDAPVLDPTFGSSPETSGRNAARR